MYDAVLVRLDILSSEIGNRVIVSGLVKGNPKFAEHMGDPKARGVAIQNGFRFFIPEISQSEGTDRWCLFRTWNKENAFDPLALKWEVVEPGIIGGKLAAND